ncbi:hypothetical protein DC914_RS25425 [Vibrio parahaemolyticus]|uniref:Uncharacterized protein n=1 Tax=Vibrio vulnificus TaxID=672 RepID=A0AAN1PVP0_VIBVL|nr:hypothetical protein [Vibrio vulnificus]EGR3228695.1 hypothetical protein [Vibrio parahaemolyticus]AXX63824.1 hypothetical protein FORC53_5485 [Vibrio vulnificus]EGR5926958.1 hypothetical protein [Vibrio parahaemolyticus]EJG0181366.1 hypothetical protein [Vibrio parahaemolyticus]KOY41439.1 hypothetical protein ACX10_01060 [Vibrio parahaemolyticus]
MSINVSDLISFLVENDANEVHANVPYSSADHPVYMVDTSQIESRQFVELKVIFDSQGKTSSNQDPMLAAEMIPELEDVPSETSLTLWFDGDRVYPTSMEMKDGNAVLKYEV